jgi:DNA-binding XRE family transcriptional regulator
MTGSELKNYRKALGLSQKSFGQIIRVSRATIAPAGSMDTEKEDLNPTPAETDSAQTNESVEISK